MEVDGAIILHWIADEGIGRVVLPSGLLCRNREALCMVCNPRRPVGAGCGKLSACLPMVASVRRDGSNRQQLLRRPLPKTSRPMTIKPLRFLTCFAVTGLWWACASAPVLFSDNFNADTSLSWTQNKAPTANATNQQATWAYNY